MHELADSPLRWVFTLISGILAKASYLLFVISILTNKGLYDNLGDGRSPLAVFRFRFEVGYFNNDKPVGEFKRYYPNGTLKASMYYLKDQKTIRAKLYFKEGPLFAIGKYCGKEKDSTWHYYSTDSVLLMVETYKNGLKQGVTKKYFWNGQLLEEKGWKDGKLHGVWRQYYPDGNIAMVTRHVEGKRDGMFQTFYENGRLQIQGNYKNSKMHGKWTFYDKDGKEEKTIVYSQGEARNEEKLDKKFNDQVEKWEKNKLPEPSIENFVKSRQKSGMDY